MKFDCSLIPIYCFVDSPRKHCRQIVNAECEEFTVIKISLTSSDHEWNPHHPSCPCTLWQSSLPKTNVESFSSFHFLYCQLSLIMENFSVCNECWNVSMLITLNLCSEQHLLIITGLSELWNFKNSLLYWLQAHNTQSILSNWYYFLNQSPNKMS